MVWQNTTYQIMAKPKGNNSAKGKPVLGKKRARLSQEDVPAYPLKEACRVAAALFENFGKSPTPPLRVAAAMDLSPSSSVFRMLAGASIAYGLTSGGYNADTISLTPLAMRIFKPLQDGDDLKARRESFLRPKVIGEFLRKYDGSPLPRNDIGKNVLEDLGVPGERSAAVFDIIFEAAKELNLLQEIKGKYYVDLRNTSGLKTEGISASEPQIDEGEEKLDGSSPDAARDPHELPPAVPITATRTTNRKVFITHGQNRAFVEPIKKLLQFGELEAVVSVEKQSVSQPVPDKVLSDMRSCSAAIIHVEDELHLLDKAAKEHVMLNPNVLIEIGAAMALFQKRFILLVKDGVRLPSNLQGLYEVRYDGDTLDGTATIKLLEAINELKKLPIVETATA